MNEWDKMRQKAAVYKAMYPVGTRIELDHMEDPWAPVPAGTRGTVVAVDDLGQLHMQWDNGRTLALVPGEDSFRRLTEKELEAERLTIDERLNAAEGKCEIVNKDAFSKEKNSFEKG